MSIKARFNALTANKNILKASIPYAVIGGMAVFIFRGIFAPGFMSGYDNSFHYYDIHYLVNVLMPKYHWINGWSMQGMAGLPILVDYYQTGPLLVAALNKLFAVQLETSYKLVVLLTYAALGGGFYKLASCRFGMVPSLAAGLCIMLQKDIYLDRILGGIWNNYLGLALFFIFLHLLDRRHGSVGVRGAAVLGLLLGLIIVTHIFVAIFAFIILFFYFAYGLAGSFGRKDLVKNALIHLSIPALAIMVSSYYLHSFLAARDYFSGYTSKDMATGILWSVKSFFGPLEDGWSIRSAFLNIPVFIRTVFGMIGFALFLRGEKDPAIRRFLAIIALFTASALLLFSDILPNLVLAWRRLPFVSTLQTNRFLVYIHMGAYVFAAYGIARSLERFRKKAIAAVIIAALVLTSAVFHYIFLARDASRTLEESPNMPAVVSLWGWVDRNIATSSGRIAYQDTSGNMDDPILGRSDVFALSGVFTKVAQIGASRSATPFPQERFMRNDHGLIFGKNLGEADDGYIKSMMDVFNAGHIVSSEPALERKLGSSALFSREVGFGPFSVFRLVRFDGGWIRFMKPARGNVTKLEPQDVEIDISNTFPENEVYISIAYHPFWKASLNGFPAAVMQDSYGLMKVALPGKGSYRLGLRFRSVDRTYNLISLAGLIAGLAAIILSREGRIRDAVT